MPELPEIRAQADRLRPSLVDRQLRRVEALSFTALKTAVPSPADAVGRSVEGLTTRGKFLLLHAGPLTFVIHLMQGGRLSLDQRLTASPRQGLMRWRFDDPPALLLTEAGRERRAGVWVVAGDPGGQPPLQGLGPEADGVSRQELAELLAATSSRLHTFLRDQRRLAGLGRRLANDVCHAARLSPFAGARSLTDEEVARLHAAIGSEITASMAFEATQNDMVRSAERSTRVHHREGTPCPACGDTVRAVTYRSYTVDYCPACQTSGRILADNTTSRFLK